MKILGTGYNIPWLPQPNEISLILDDTLPARYLITSALALAFHEGNFLMTKLHQRGWDIPGGHIEPGERPEETMRREVMEEAAVELGNVRLFGYQRIRLLGEVPVDYRYPHPDSYQVFYVGTVDKILPFTATAEAGGRSFFSRPKALQQRWVQENRLMFDAAYHMITQ
ncbi:MAG: NUDIX domain-containing protein [Caldilineaceae bacterium]